MAGVIAHNKAIVSSANARILVILISVLLPLTTRNKDNTSNFDANPPLTTTAVTVITALELTEIITSLG
jgi:hypothetical protein